MNYFIKTLQAGKNSLAGIVMAFKLERAVRLESIIFIPFLLLAFLSNLSSIEKILLVFPIFLIFVCEFFNSALEKTIDELGNGKICPAFKFAKDICSAAVLLMIIMAIFSWLLLYFPYLKANFF